MRKLIIIITLFAVSVILVAAASADDIGEGKFPDFKLKSPSGCDVVLADLIGERPIVITFWATWCKPCKKELEKMKPIFDELKDDIYFIAICEDGPRSRSKVPPYIKSEGFEYFIALDKNKDVMMRAGVSDIPDFFILDLEGNIIYRHRGYKLGNELKHKKAIEKLLSSLPTTAESDVESKSDLKSKDE